MSADPGSAVPRRRRQARAPGAADERYLPYGGSGTADDSRDEAPQAAAPPATRRARRAAERAGQQPPPPRAQPLLAVPADPGAEPTAPTPAELVEATADVPRSSRAGRNLPAAIAVGLVMGALALSSLLFYKEAFVGLVSLAIVIGVTELGHGFSAKQIALPVVPLAVGSLGMLVSAFSAGSEGLLVAFCLTALGVLLWRVLEGVAGAVRDVTAGVFAAAYLPFLAGFSMLLLAPVDGPRRVITFILVTVASDVGGYAAGVLFGRHPMAPTVSPKKSWEGFAGSTLVCVGTGAACTVYLMDAAWWPGAVLGAAAVVSATVGDLSESLLKRDLGIKDMGRLLPGHGGIMDRLDSLVPTAPVAYLVLLLLVPPA